MARIPSNQEIARVFSTIADYLAMQDVPFKPRAYERVAETVATLDRSLADVYNEGGIRALEEVPGVGESIAAKIEELLTTGTLRYYEKLRRSMPVDVPGLTAIEGVDEANVELVWDPPWNQGMMTDAAKLQLGLY